MKARNCASVNTKVCVSCGACIEVCPLQAIHTPNGCYAVVDTNRCVGCGKCSRICPTGCITIAQRTEVSDEDK